MEKSIVLIMGAGRSGSTILDMSLGNYPQAFSGGEIINLTHNIKKNKYCACGKKIKECSFWSQIIYQANINNSINNYKLNLKWKNPKRYLVLFLNILTVKISGKLFLKDKNFDKSVNQLYSSIFKNSKSTIIIDSSKSPIWILFVYFSNIIKYNKKVIYLVRDGRSFIYSLAFKNKSISHKKTKNIWIKANILSLIVNWLIPTKNKFFLRYEDFVNNPIFYSKKIYDFLNIEFNEEITMDFRKIVFHNIGGNPTKFKSNTLHRPKENWRNLKSFNTKKHNIVFNYLLKKNKYK